MRFTPTMTRTDRASRAALSSTSTDPGAPVPRAAGMEVFSVSPARKASVLDSMPKMLSSNGAASSECDVAGG